MTRIQQALALASIAVLLTGCGFRPLYRATATNAVTTTSLEKIRVSSATTTTDAAFRNFLLDRIAPGGPAEKYDYELNYRINERQVGGGVRIDASVTRFNLQLNASYELKGLKDRETIFNGSSQSVVAYDVLNSQFATVIGRENARERASRELANNIVLRLSLFFDRQAEAELAAVADETTDTDETIETD